MRITYIHQHFRLPTEAGGTRSWEFARRLVAEGHEVVVVAAAEIPEVTDIGGIRLIRLKSGYRNQMRPYQRVAAFVAFMWRSTWCASRLPADVVFATSTPLTVAVPGIIASKVRRARFVFEVRDLWPSVPIEMGWLRNPILIFAARALERIAYSTADSVVALSPDMAKGVTSVSPNADVTVVPNACDFELFGLGAHHSFESSAREPSPDAGLLLVYAGSLGASYDPTWLGEFAATMIGRGFDFVIIGDGAGRRTIEAILERSGIDPEPVVLGKRSKYEVASFMAECGATISSLAEYKGLEANSLNKVFDSFAASRPVILNHGGWLSDLVQEHDAGLRVSRNATEAAAECSSWLISQNLEKARVSSHRIGKLFFDRDELYSLFRGVLLDSSRPGMSR